MLCDRCKKNQANIYYTKFTDGKMEGVRLCFSCAKEVMGSDISMSEEIKKQIEDMLKPVAEIENPEIKDKICPTCGRRLSEILKSGRLGCKDCYENFSDDLIKFLDSVGGFSIHKGHAPENYKGKTEAYRKEMEVRERLEMAISLEDYEQAAIYRDKLKTLGEKND
ncbi:hypothetical protein LV469_03525 [Peptoniphilus sp. GNH]|nr:hypothetical protein HMPREF3189_00330 [Clostridiales bacterium KA00134]UHR03374.1 hypothetical protein LV469_03525 [Peptoniphilus sp. GNH]